MKQRECLPILEGVVGLSAQRPSGLLPLAVQGPSGVSALGGFAFLQWGLPTRAVCDSGLGLPGEGPGRPVMVVVGPLRPIGNRPRHTINPRSLTVKGPGAYCLLVPGELSAPRDGTKPGTGRFGTRSEYQVPAPVKTRGFLLPPHSSFTVCRVAYGTARAR